MNTTTTRFDRSIWGNGLAAACAWLAVLGAATAARGQCNPQEMGHLFASDAVAFNYFSVSVAISGDTAVVGNSDDDTAAGADVGSAYVFVRSGPPGSEVWTEQAHLFASDGAANDSFGGSVAISGDTAIVGAWGDNTPHGSNVGSAYIFVRSGPPGSEVWTEQAHLFASDGAAIDEFGISVAISGDTALVTAWGDDTPGGTDAGSAYVFVRSGTVWTQKAHLFASDGAAGDRFGFWSTIAISADTIVLGAHLDDTAGGVDAGSAYIFDLSGGVWTEDAHLFASDGAAGDQFGYAVEISGDTVVVGAYLDNTPGGTDAGSAYVFVRSGGGWTQQAHLFASDGAAGDNFTSDIAISADTVVVAAYLDDTPGGTDAGSAYVFTRGPGGTTWTEEAHFFASDGAAGDRFGYGVEISGDTLAVGAWQDDTRSGGVDAGSVYIFGLDCPPACPTDLDGNGAVDAADLATLLGAWGPNRGHPADFDGNGIIDAADLANVLGSWGPCPG